MSRTIEAIVVGVASVHQPDPVLRHAISLAKDLDVELHVVHAFQFTDTVVNAYVRIGRGTADIHTRFCEMLQQRLREQVAGLSTSPRILTDAEAGPTDWVVGEVAEQAGAALVVVGATRQGTLGRHLLGTTAERVVRASTRPVLLVREHFVASTQRILLATDLSDFSAGIFARGTQLLAALIPYAAPELRPLLVVPYNTGFPPPLDRLTLTGVASTELERFLTEQQVADARSAGVVRVGDPAAEILAEATEWQADLIVLGTHGRRGLSRLALGSVATKVMRDARCNVLVIPAGAAEEERAASGAAATVDTGEIASV